MSPERVWGKIYFCHTCRKYLEDETGMRAHQFQEHKAESYISMPKDIDKREAPKEEIKSPTIMDEVKKDYADIEETEDWEIGA